MKRIITAATVIVALTAAAPAADAHSYRSHLRHLRAEQAGAVYGILQTNAIERFYHCPFHRGVPTRSGRPRCRFLLRVRRSLEQRASVLSAEVVAIEVAHRAA